VFDSLGMAAIERPAPKLSRVWVGANFWSRVGGPLMWRTFDEQVVRSELHVLMSHGLNVTRSFLYWPDFMPEPDRLAEPFIERYARFLDLHLAANMTTIPTFIVGQMSGENWDVPWRYGRDLYADGWMLAQQAFYLREIASRFKDHPSVCAWLISNEMPVYGGDDAPAENVRSWAQLMVQAIRAGGATQPVSLGDGAWGVEVTGVDNGFRLRDLARTVDFVGPHCYPMEDDAVRQHLTAAFNCELSHVGLPVVLEEFGVSSDHASDTAAADYYRQVLNSTLLAGAVGWLAWNNTDFELAAQDPYRHHPFELHFGITRADGSPKLALLELERFHRTLEQIDFAGCDRAPTEVAVVVPSYFDTDYPFIAPSQRPLIRGILLQAYVAAREAGLPPALVRELDGVPPAQLILLPSTQALTGPTWAELEARAAAGSTVYCSYFSGGVKLRRGPWHSHFNEFFGVEHKLRYGLVDAVEDEAVTWTFETGLGDLAPGTTLSFRVAGNPHGRAYLPVIPGDAQVVARDVHGRPALLVREVGSGRIVLSTYPTEYFASARAGANPEDTHRLYGALAILAGIDRAVVSSRPDVLVDSLVHRDGSRYVWFLSQAAEPVKLRPGLPQGQELVDLEAGEPVAEVNLRGYGVAVYRLAAMAKP
jgi:endo-1,4-beta-mannosidase